MATRRIPQDEVLFRVSNTGSDKIVIPPRSVSPGQSTLIPARYIVGNVDRCMELAHHMLAGRASVQLVFDNMGYVGTVLSPEVMMSYQAATAAPFGLAPPYANSAKPAGDEVPEGFTFYNTTSDTLNLSDGTSTYVVVAVV